MAIKWNKAAVQQLLRAISFIEENGFYTYAVEHQQENKKILNLLNKISLISSPPHSPQEYASSSGGRRSRKSFCAQRGHQYRRAST